MPMAKGRIVGALSFDALERAFVAALRDAPGGPDRRVWVLAPTNLLCRHLQRAAAAAAGGVLGVEFITLRDAALAGAGAEMASEGLRPIPEGARELVLQRALDGLPRDAYMAAFREFPGSVSAIARTIELLKNGLWTPASLAQAAEAAGERARQRRIRELSALWAECEGFKSDERLFDAEDVLLAARAAPPLEALFVYGFYDLTPLQAALVARLAEGAAVGAAFLLWHEAGGEPAPGFEYAAPVVEFLKACFGAAGVECLGQEGEGDLGKLRREIFADVGPAADEQTPVPFDGSVGIVNCPGEAAECEEIAREVLLSFRAEEGGEVAVLARDAREVAEGVCEALDRAQLRYYQREGRPLAGTMPGRIALALLDLAGGEARRADVVAFLSLARVEWPGELSPTALDRLARRAGVVRGWESWAERLDVLARSLESEADRAELEVDAGPLREDAALARSAAELLKGLLAEVLSLGSATTWAATAGALESLTVRFVAEGEEGLEEVRRIVRGLAPLDVTGVAPDLSRVRWLLRRAFYGEGRRAGAFQRVRVTFASVMASRGTTHDVVMVPRMIEKAFPRHIGADPLLSEGDREALNAVASRFGGGELPLQSRRPEEERYLFRVALGSARRAVVLFYPRIEQDTGKPRVVSRFVQQACEAMCGRLVRPSELEDGNLVGLVRRVRLGADRSPDEALDAWEHDLWAHAASDDVGAAVEFSATLSEQFGRAVAMDMSRWSQVEFGPHDGKVRAGDLVEALRTRHDPAQDAISATRLETYAACPFSYFLKYVLGLDEPEEPAEAVDLSALEWGSILHKVLATAYARSLKGKRLSSVTDGDIDETLRAAGEELDRVGAALGKGRATVWRAARRRALREIRRVLEFERQQNAGAAPAHFELSFGPDQEQEAFELQVVRDRTVRFRGRMDRVDELEDGGIQVVDYKTGKAKNAAENSFAGGVQLQLPLYLLAAARVLEQGSGRARYLFTSGPSVKEEFTLDALSKREKDLRRIVALILEGIAAGDFFLLQKDGGRGRRCVEHCAFRNICGLGRSKLMEIKGGAANRRDLKRLEELWNIK